jgi:hypothetical protein
MNVKILYKSFKRDVVMFEGELLCDLQNDDLIKVDGVDYVVVEKLLNFDTQELEITVNKLNRTSYI